MSESAITSSPENEPLVVGAALRPQSFATSVVQVFRYSAATWNTHRIHYDHDYAQKEGYPGVLVQSHLHGAFLTKYCTDFLTDGSLRSLSLRVRRFAVAGETLIVSAVVTAIEPVDDGNSLVSVELSEQRESDGEVCVTGEATWFVPTVRTKVASS